MPRTLPALLKNRLPEAGTRQVLLMSLIGLFTWLQGTGLCQDTTFGIVWDQPILLSDTTCDAYSPKIALSGDDTVHVTWENGGTNLRLPYRRSVNGGMNFGDAVELLVDSLSFPYHANWVQVVAEGSRVFVFFQGSSASFTPVRMISSTTSGETWGKPLDISPDSCGEVRSVAVVGDTMGVVYSPEGIKRILRSTDGGQTWTRTNEDLDYFARIALSPGVLHLVQTGAVGSIGEVEYRRSTDLGDTWSQQMLLSSLDGLESIDPSIAAGNFKVIAAWRDPKYGCLGGAGCSIIARRGISGVDSTSWFPEQVLTTIPLGYEPSLSVRGSQLAAAWPMDHESPPYAQVTVLLHDTTWCPPSDPVSVRTKGVIQVAVALSSTAVHVVWEASQAPSPSTFRIFYCRGRLIDTGVDDQGNQVPNRTTLSRNFPNPFNPVTTIRYETSTRTRIVLRVYDPLGREVATLETGMKEPGQYTVEWNAGDLPSGVYFYQLIAGDRMETRKAIVLK